MSQMKSFSILRCVAHLFAVMVLMLIVYCLTTVCHVDDIKQGAAQYYQATAVN